MSSPRAPAPGTQIGCPDIRVYNASYAQASVLLRSISLTLTPLSYPFFRDIPSTLHFQVSLHSHYWLGKLILP
jgi:hypothetical protein